MTKISSGELFQRTVILTLALVLASSFLLVAGVAFPRPVNQIQLRWAFAFDEEKADVAVLKEIGSLVTDYFPEEDGIWLGGTESWWLPAPASAEHRFLELRLFAPDWRTESALVTVMWSDFALGVAEIAPGSSSLMSIDLEPLVGSNFKTFLSMNCSPAERVPGSLDTRDLCVKMVEVRSVREASQ